MIWLVFIIGQGLLFLLVLASDILLPESNGPFPLVTTSKLKSPVASQSASVQRFRADVQPQNANEFLNFDLMSIILSFCDLDASIELQLTSKLLRSQVQMFIYFMAMSSAPSILNHHTEKYFWPKLSLFAIELSRLFHGLFPAYSSDDAQLAFGDVAELCRFGLWHLKSSSCVGLAERLGGRLQQYFELEYTDDPLMDVANIYVLESILNCKTVTMPEKLKISLDSMHPEAINLFQSYHCNVSIDPHVLIMKFFSILSSGQFSNYLYAQPAVQAFLNEDQGRRVLFACALDGDHFDAFLLALKLPWQNCPHLVSALRRLYVEEEGSAIEENDYPLIDQQFLNSAQMDGGAFKLLTIFAKFPLPLDAFERQVLKRLRVRCDDLMQWLVHYERWEHFVALITHQRLHLIEFSEEFLESLDSMIFRSIKDQELIFKLVAKLVKYPTFTMKSLMKMKLMFFKVTKSSKNNCLSHD